MHPQQTTFENIVTKEGIAQNEQFLLLPQCFQLFLIITLIYGDFSCFCLYISNVVYCKFIVCEKGLKIEHPLVLYYSPIQHHKPTSVLQERSFRR